MALFSSLTKRIDRLKEEAQALAADAGVAVNAIEDQIVALSIRQTEATRVQGAAMRVLIAVGGPDSTPGV